MLQSIGVAVLFGVVGIVLSIVGYKIFDLLETKINFSEEIERGNLAVAILLGSFLIGICFIIGRAVGS